MAKGRSVTSTKIEKRNTRTHRTKVDEDREGNDEDVRLPDEVAAVDLTVMSRHDKREEEGY